GDGTVPYWSAFHTSSVNRIDLARASDHGILLEHREVMELVAGIVTNGKPVSTPRTSTKAGMRAPRKASDRRLRAVMKSAARAANASKPLPAAFFEKTVQRALFSKLIW